MDSVIENEEVKRYFVAEIEWIPFEEGGRRSVPYEGARYCPIIDLGTSETWSIDFICPDFSKTNTVKFSFLSENAPEDLIEISKKYRLKEGSRDVAYLIVNEEWKSNEE